MLLWGFSYVWTKIVFKYYDPLTTVFFRLLLSSLFLLPFIYLFRNPRKIQKKHIGLFFFSALFNPFFYFLGESFGLQLVSSTISSVIIAMIPVFTPIVALISLNEKLNKLNIAGMLISFLGIMIMLVKKDLSLMADPKGIIFLFGAVLAALIYGVLLKRLTAHYKSVTIIAYQNLIGSLYFLPLFLIFEYDQFIQVKPNFELVSSLLLLAVFASSLAFILYTDTVRSIGISKANIYTNLIPVFTGVSSFFILAESFTPAKVVGVLVVILGVVLSQMGHFTLRKKTLSNK